MIFKTSKSQLKGSIRIPGSKSHTIRAVLIASLAEGKSTLHFPLESSDTDAAISVFSKLGATFNFKKDKWIISGIGENMRTPQETLDVMNSGTTLRVLMGICCLNKNSQKIKITGDEQIKKRPLAPLIKALNDLGADVKSINNNQCAPIEVGGELSGGTSEIECISSQYLTSLLLACPLAKNDTVINVPVLNEKSYVAMTLDWLEKQKIKVQHENMKKFFIAGNQKFTAFERAIPADFSSATFFLCAGALPGNEIICTGLDTNDTQGDKQVINYLKEMGANIEVMPSGDIKVCGDRTLHGIDIDMNETPDALPMMALTACFAKGKTRLFNVAQARIKETDRIKVMCTELRKMGANIEELPDGLLISHSDLKASTELCGHSDHRVVMSLAIAGMMTKGISKIATAESVSVTFPLFKDYINSIGGLLS